MSWSAVRALQQGPSVSSGALIKLLGVLTNTSATADRTLDTAACETILQLVMRPEQQQSWAERVALSEAVRTAVMAPVPPHRSAPSQLFNSLLTAAQNRSHPVSVRLSAFLIAGALIESSALSSDWGGRVAAQSLGAAGSGGASAGNIQSATLFKYLTSAGMPSEPILKWAALRLVRSVVIAAGDSLFSMPPASSPAAQVAVATQSHVLWCETLFKSLKPWLVWNDSALHGESGRTAVMLSSAAVDLIWTVIQHGCARSTDIAIVQSFLTQLLQQLNWGITAYSTNHVSDRWVMAPTPVYFAPQSGGIARLVGFLLAKMVRLELPVVQPAQRDIAILLQQQVLAYLNTSTPLLSALPPKYSQSAVSAAQLAHLRALQGSLASLYEAFFSQLAAPLLARNAPQIIKHVCVELPQQLCALYVASTAPSPQPTASGANSWLAGVLEALHTESSNNLAHAVRVMSTGLVRQIWRDCLLPRLVQPPSAPPALAIVRALLSQITSCLSESPLLPLVSLHCSLLAEELLHSVRYLGDRSTVDADLLLDVLKGPIYAIVTQQNPFALAASTLPTLITAVQLLARQRDDSLSAAEWILEQLESTQLRQQQEMFALILAALLTARVPPLTSDPVPLIVPYATCDRIHELVKKVRGADNNSDSQMANTASHRVTSALLAVALTSLVNTHSAYYTSAPHRSLLWLWEAEFDSCSTPGARGSGNSQWGLLRALHLWALFYAIPPCGSTSSSTTYDLVSLAVSLTTALIMSIQPQQPQWPIAILQIFSATICSVGCRLAAQLPSHWLTQLLPVLLPTLLKPIPLVDCSFPMLRLIWCCVPATGSTLVDAFSAWCWNSPAVTSESDAGSQLLLDTLISCGISEILLAQPDTVQVVALQTLTATSPSAPVLQLLNVIVQVNQRSVMLEETPAPIELHGLPNQLSTSFSGSELGFSFAEHLSSDIFTGSSAHNSRVPNGPDSELPLHSDDSSVRYAAQVARTALDHLQPLNADCASLIANAVLLTLWQTPQVVFAPLVARIIASLATVDESLHAAMVKRLLALVRDGKRESVGPPAIVLSHIMSSVGSVRCRTYFAEAIKSLLPRLKETLSIWGTEGWQQVALTKNPMREAKEKEWSYFDATTLLLNQIIDSARLMYDTAGAAVSPVGATDLIHFISSQLLSSDGLVFCLADSNLTASLLQLSAACIQAVGPEIQLSPTITQSIISLISYFDGLIVKNQPSSVSPRSAVNTASQGVQRRLEALLSSDKQTLAVRTDCGGDRPAVTLSCITLKHKLLLFAPALAMNEPIHECMEPAKLFFSLLRTASPAILYKMPEYSISPTLIDVRRASIRTLRLLLPLAPCGIDSTPDIMHTMLIIRDHEDVISLRQEWKELLRSLLPLASTGVSTIQFSASLLNAFEEAQQPQVDIDISKSTTSSTGVENTEEEAEEEMAGGLTGTSTRGTSSAGSPAVTSRREEIASPESDFSNWIPNTDSFLLSLDIASKVLAGACGPDGLLPPESSAPLVDQVMQLVFKSLSSNRWRVQSSALLILAELFRLAKFIPDPNPEYTGHFLLELYKAQVSTILRQLLNLGDSMNASSFRCFAAVLALGTAYIPWLSLNTDASLLGGQVRPMLVPFLTLGRTISLYDTANVRGSLTNTWLVSLASILSCLPSKWSEDIKLPSWWINLLVDSNYQLLSLACDGWFFLLQQQLSDIRPSCALICQVSSSIPFVSWEDPCPDPQVLRHQQRLFSICLGLLSQALVSGVSLYAVDDMHRLFVASSLLVTTVAAKCTTHSPLWSGLSTMNQILAEQLAQAIKLDSNPTSDVAMRSISAMLQTFAAVATCDPKSAPKALLDVTVQSLCSLRKEAQPEATLELCKLVSRLLPTLVPSTSLAKELVSWELTSLLRLTSARLDSSWTDVWKEIRQSLDGSSLIPFAINLLIGATHESMSYAAASLFALCQLLPAAARLEPTLQQTIWIDLGRLISTILSAEPINQQILHIAFDVTKVCMALPASISTFFLSHLVPILNKIIACQCNDSAIFTLASAILLFCATRFPDVDATTVGLFSTFALSPDSSVQTRLASVLLQIAKIQPEIFRRHLQILEPKTQATLQQTIQSLLQTASSHSSGMKIDVSKF